MKQARLGYTEGLKGQFHLNPKIHIFPLTCAIAPSRLFFFELQSFGNKGAMSLSRKHELVTKDSPCCERFHVRTVFFLLNYAISLRREKHASKHG